MKSILNAKYLTLIAFLTCNFQLIGGNIQTFTIHSASMKKNISNTIVLPNKYQKGNVSYPVLYLLHGAGGNHKSWVESVPKLKTLVDQYNIIIVCPDGNLTSWYIDSPVDENSKYATYINFELISAVEEQFKTLKGEENRAITGFSMGGHGALYSAFTYPEKWDYVGSISGGVDLEPFTKNWDLPLRLGAYESNGQNWKEHSVVNMVKEPLGDPFSLNIICGNEDFFLDVNNKLNTILSKKKIDAVYDIVPGKHTWSFCNKVIESQIIFFVECMKG